MSPVLLKGKAGGVGAESYRPLQTIGSLHEQAVVPMYRMRLVRGKGRSTSGGIRPRAGLVQTMGVVEGQGFGHGPNKARRRAPRAGSANPADWLPTMGAVSQQRTGKSPANQVVDGWCYEDYLFYVFKSHSWNTRPPAPDCHTAMTDVDLECEHGRLAGDPCPSPIWRSPEPCGCWPSEAAPEPAPLNGNGRRRNGRLSAPKGTTLGRTPRETVER